MEVASRAKEKSVVTDRKIDTGSRTQNTERHYIQEINSVSQISHSENNLVNAHPCSADPIIGSAYRQPGNKIGWKMRLLLVLAAVGNITTSPLAANGRLQRYERKTADPCLDLLSPFPCYPGAAQNIAIHPQRRDKRDNVRAKRDIRAMLDIAVENFDAVTVGYDYRNNQSEVCRSDIFMKKCVKEHKRIKKENQSYRRLILNVGKIPCFCPSPLYPVSLLSLAAGESVTQNSVRIFKTRETRNDINTINRFGISEIKEFTETICEIKNKIENFAQLLNILGDTFLNERISETAIIKFGTWKFLFRLKLLDIGCEIIANPQKKALSYLYDIADDLLSIFPKYHDFPENRFLVGKLFHYFSDVFDSGDREFTHVSESRKFMLNFWTSIVTSLPYNHAQAMYINNDDFFNDMISAFSIMNKIILLKTKNAGEVMVDIDSGILVEKKSRKRILFNMQERQWDLHTTTATSDSPVNIMNKIKHYCHGYKEILLFINSDKNWYGDASLILKKGMLSALIGHQCYPIKEVKLNNGHYKYIYTYPEKETTITLTRSLISIKDKWYFESETSPAISNELCAFVKHQSSHILTADVTDYDVTLMDISNGLHQDAELNNYLKIEGKYYKLFHDSYNYGDFIDGENVYIPLKKGAGKWDLKHHILDGTEGWYRAEINAECRAQHPEQYYLDSSVLESIKNSEGWLESQIDGDPELGKIPGTVRFADKDYFCYDGKFIEVGKNGDNTFFIVTSKSDFHQNIIYKNPVSYTFFILEDKPIANIATILNTQRNNHCIVKRNDIHQCVAYSESRSLATLLLKHITFGIKISDPKTFLERDKFSANLYRDKRYASAYLYHYRDAIYFHARVNKNDFATVPVYFTLHGSREDNSLDTYNIIGLVSVVEDYDNNELITCTYQEAMKSILIMDDVKSDIESTRQKMKYFNKDFQIKDLEKMFPVEKKLRSLPADFPIEPLQPLYEMSGKKALFSPGQKREDLINSLNDMLGRDLTSHLYKYYSEETQLAYPEIVSTLSEAILKAEEAVKTCLNSFKTSRKVIYYIYNDWDIKEHRARMLFYYALVKKVKRLKMIINDNFHNNIYLYHHKDITSTLGRDSIDFKDNKELIAFVIPNDNFKRVFINIDIFPESYKVSDLVQKEFYTNLMTETLIHEASHLVNSGWDTFYLPVFEDGKFREADKVPDYIGHTILHEKNGANFKLICENYFIRNKIYHKYNFKSLMAPENLLRIFHADDFLKSLVMINNADALTFLIEDISKLEGQGERSN